MKYFVKKAGDHLYNNSSYFIDVGGIGHLSPGSRHHDPLPFLVSFPKLWIRYEYLLLSFDALLNEIEQFY